MRATRLFALLVLLPLSAFAASEDADDWKLIGGVLALVQQIVHLAAHSPDPDAAQRGVDAMLAGENAQANRIASGAMEEIMQDIPLEQRAAFVSIGRDLHAMGLRYWDEQQFAEAAKRGDRIAVDLFFVAQGLPQPDLSRNPPPAR